MRDLAYPSVLLIDIETSGLPRRDLSIDDPAQPWAMSVAAALCNSAGVFTNFCMHIIKADGRTVKEGAEKVHGIPRDAASKIGIPEPRVMGVLLDMMKTAPYDEELKVVTYGDFDMGVLASLFARYAIAQNKPANTYDRQWLARPHKSHVISWRRFARSPATYPANSKGRLIQSGRLSTRHARSFSACRHGPGNMMPGKTCCA
jgi:hypothetical protein